MKTATMGLSLVVIISFGMSFMLDTKKEQHTIFDTGLYSTTVGGKEVHVALADSLEERRRGLSGLTSIDEDKGLLFVFPQKGTHSIWMKNMHFSIDVMWLDENLRVIDIEKNLSPQTYPQTFQPRSPALYVLEVPAGFSDAYGIKIGNTLVWNSQQTL